MPSVVIDFMTGALPAGATLTRASLGWHYNAAGVLTQAAINTARFDYDPGTLALRGLLNEPALTNNIRNSSAVGGSSGSQPTNWNIAGNSDGLTRTLVGIGTEDGIPYYELRYAGTATANNSRSIAFEPNTQIAALEGQPWTVAMTARLIGTPVGANVNVNLTPRDAGGGNIAGAGLNFPVTVTGARLASQTVSVSGNLVGATTAFVRGVLLLVYTIGQVIDVTIRVGNPQITPGLVPMSPIPTTTVAVTRDADVLTVPLLNGTYDITVNRVSGPTTYSGQVVTTGSWTVPTDASPLQTVQASLLTATLDFTTGTLPAGATLSRASVGNYWAAGTQDTFTISDGPTAVAGTGVLALPVTGITASVGDLLFLTCTADNNTLGGFSSTLPGITDPTGNVWTRLSETTRNPSGTAQDGTTLSVWGCSVTVPMVASTATINFSASSRAVAGIKRVVPNVGAAAVIEAVGPGVAFTSSNQSSGPVTVGSGRAMLAWTGRESNVVATADADATNGAWSAAQVVTADTGVTNSSVTMSGQHKTTTGAGSQSYDTTGSGDYALNYVIVNVLRAQLTSAAINVARFTHDPVAGVLQGLLNEPTATNILPNSSCSGSVPGTPGNPPTGWAVGGSSNNVTRTIVGSGTEDGIPYVDIRYAGTPSASGNVAIRHSATTGNAALPDQVWSASVYCRLMAGTVSGSLNYQICPTDGGGAVLNPQTTVVIAPTNAPLRTQRFVNNAGVLANAAVVAVHTRFQIGYVLNVPMDYTLRVGLPQLMLGATTSSPITTTTVALTRSPSVLTIPVPDGIYDVSITRLDGTENIPGALASGGYVVPNSLAPVRSVTLAAVAVVVDGQIATPVVIVVGQPVFAGPATPHVMVTSGEVYDGPATPIQIVVGRPVLGGPATPMRVVTGRPVLPGKATPVL